MPRHPGGLQEAGRRKRPVWGKPRTMEQCPPLPLRRESPSGASGPPTTPREAEQSKQGKRPLLRNPADRCRLSSSKAGIHPCPATLELANPAPEPLRTGLDRKQGHGQDQSEVGEGWSIDQIFYHGEMETMQEIIREERREGRHD